ncbi:MAG: radical SAM family heme chaperone HemW [Ignavibacteria bacterium]|nr:radical SAM family heme chaperone HemW [Ignavibacteria bacterium]
MGPHFQWYLLMFGLYLHIPFCEKKCSYCDFYSIESLAHVDRFTDVLLQEIDLRRDQYSGAMATSVFFGGGTPSLLSPKAIGRINERLRETIHIGESAEWTMECNPGTVTLDRLEAYHATGINRLSFGVQSFTASELAFLDRIHDADQAEQAMVLARKAGFRNVNMDLMFAVPGQTIETLTHNLECMVALQPDHISAYSLIYEHGTPLYAKLKKGLVQPLPEEVDVEMYKLVIDTLRSAGYHQYEVSNFAKPGFECKHNLTYWHAANYLAYGPSAHGFVGTTRYWNKRSLTSWMQDVSNGTLPEANREELTPQDLLSEFLFLHLRADGIPLHDVQSKFNIDLRKHLHPNLQYWIDEGFINDANNVLSLTAEGYRVCDELTVKILGTRY